MTKVYADLSEDGKTIEIYFKYDYGIVQRVKRTARFVPPREGGPYWKAPLDFAVGTYLRNEFGDDFVTGDALLAWARQERRTADKLIELANAEDADLHRLPKVLPELAAFLRPYQRSGARFTAAAPASLIADQPGLGKTVQSIAGIYEAGNEIGSHLVIAPPVSLESVWKKELERFQPLPVWVPQGSRKEREQILEDFLHYTQTLGGHGWLVVNPHMVALRRVAPTCTACSVLMEKYHGKFVCPQCRSLDDADLVPTFSEIGNTVWSNIIIDEAHKNAVRNPKTLTARAMFKLLVTAHGKRIALSGTPIRNRPIDLWGVLHWMYPEKFSSKWRWVGQWLEVTDNGYGKVIGGIREDRKVDFYKSLSPYVLRRTKAEVLPELPPKDIVPIWVSMSGKQRAQYREFEKEAALKMGDETLVADIYLSEIIRLKQFAIATQELRDGKPFPTFDSAKINAVEELLEERGFFDGTSDEKVVIFSQFERVVDMVCAWLTEKGVDNRKIAGKQNRVKGLSQKIQNEFQADDGPRAIVMTTETGGVSITLDRADSCIFMDETWLASDLEQAEDRLHRASRMHNVTCYYVRTRGTIDEHIMEVVADKANVAKGVLDDRRALLKKMRGAA